MASQKDSFSTVVIPRALKLGGAFIRRACLLLRIWYTLCFQMSPYSKSRLGRTHDRVCPVNNLSGVPLDLLLE